MDLDAVIDAAAKAGTMIEINANPHRLDLDAVHCRRARDKGVPIVINPDAHSTGGLDDLDYGISVARRGWLDEVRHLEHADVEGDAPEDRRASRPALIVRTGRPRPTADGPCGG